jgi:hypothetical protein
MFNPQRGEIAVEIDGARHGLRFTLGALAEIEVGLGVDDAQAFSARFSRLGAGDLQTVLAALLRAGGAAEPDALAANAAPHAAAQAVAACLKANLT